MATSTTTVAAPFVNWPLLGNVVLTSVIIGVGLVVAFSVGLAALSVARGTQRTALERASGSVVTFLMGAAITASLVWGLVLIIKK
jgi:hypothetical protein